jgi:anti-anti-sigma regulatory factor
MHKTHTEVTADGSQQGLSRPRLARSPSAPSAAQTWLALWLSGALDIAPSALRDREFHAQASHAAHLAVDLTGLELIDSSGLETLVRTRRRATENDQRTAFRQGPHSGRLPLELSHDAHGRFQPAARRANVSANEKFARATQCADVDHQRPLVIDHPPWMGASGHAAGASDAHPLASLAPRRGLPSRREPPG